MTGVRIEAEEVEAAIASSLAIAAPDALRAMIVAFGNACASEQAALLNALAHSLIVACDKPGALSYQADLVSFKLTPEARNVLQHFAGLG